MSELVVKVLEGIIRGEEEGTGFVELPGDINGAAGFTSRRIKLEKGTKVDVVALLFLFEDGTYGHNQLFGVRTKEGMVSYDLMADDPEQIPYMTKEARELFPEARKMLYEE